MIAYRCYLLDANGHITNSQVIECSTDADALQEAQRRLAAAECPGIEVWDKGRRVGTVGVARDQSERTTKASPSRLDSSWAQD